jgi:hypothetical protein
MEPLQLFSVSRRFDNYLAPIRADQLKAMARLWDGKGLTRKDEFIEAIRTGLQDPQRVRMALVGLDAAERNALALAKQMGGQIEVGALEVGLHASGISLPARFRNPYYGGRDQLVRHLIQRGLMLVSGARDPSYLYSSYGTNFVFSDERLLADIGAPEVHPLKIKPVPPPPTSTYRRPPTVVLDIISILQAIDSLGGLGLTQKGEVRVNDERKVKRALRWGDDGLDVDGFWFPEPARAWTCAFRNSGLLDQSNDRLILKEPTDHFASRPYHEQVAILLNGLIRTGEWKEIPQDRWYSSDGKYFAQGRLALMMLLASLPPDSEAFYAVDELDQALFSRIGEHFSLNYPPQRPFTYSKSPEEVVQIENEWRLKLRTDWLKRERKWLDRAFSTWLYFLGIVELGISGDLIVSLRLTDLGRAVLHPELSASFNLTPERTPAQAQEAWIVQPNFDVVAFLDRTTPEQIAFLERHAERVQAQQHTAHYRLTRASVYWGLENGTALEDLLQGLQAGSSTELPQNVVVEIREWAALRERLTLYRRANLLEFASADRRQQALEQGIQGTPIGENYLLLAVNGAPEQKQLKKLRLPAGWALNRINYAQALPECLGVSETGLVQLLSAAPDLWIEAQLGMWATALGQKQWQLSATSVAGAIRNGLRLPDLLKLLSDRLSHPLPPLLGVALRAWAGDAPKAELGEVTLLRCRQPEVFQAVLQSPRLKPLLRGALAPDLLLVEPGQLAALQAELAWAGFKLSDQLTVLPAADGRWRR